jgi:hypothetical protein
MAIGPQVKLLGFIEHVAAFERLLDHGLLVAHVGNKLRRKERQANVLEQPAYTLLTHSLLKTYVINEKLIKNNMQN